VPLHTDGEDRRRSGGVSLDGYGTCFGRSTARLIAAVDHRSLRARRWSSGALTLRPFWDSLVYDWWGEEHPEHRALLDARCALRRSSMRLRAGLPVADLAYGCDSRGRPDSPRLLYEGVHMAT